MAANAQAVADDAGGVSAEIAGQLYAQKPQRYAAKAFAELRRKRALVDDADLAALLEETGCDAFLASSEVAALEADEPEESETEEEADED
jgi:hypothetical protein